MNHIDKNENKVIPAPRVQDMLQKFEANRSSTSPGITSEDSSSQDKKRNSKLNFVSNKSKSVDVCENAPVNKNLTATDSITTCGERKHVPVHRKHGNNQSPVSVVQRTKLFQQLDHDSASPKSPERTFRSSVKLKVTPLNSPKEIQSIKPGSELGPLPAGPPPRKPPRSMIHSSNINSEVVVSAKTDDSLNLNVNNSCNSENDRPIPAARRKSSVPNSLEADSGNEEVMLRKKNIPPKPSSFLHNKYENRVSEYASSAKHNSTVGSEQQKSPLTVVVTTEKKVGDRTSVTPKSPRTKNIQRPKIPPPRPPPPQQVHEYKRSQSFNSKSCAPNQHGSINIRIDGNIAENSSHLNSNLSFKEREYDEVPVDEIRTKKRSAVIRRSVSDEHLYAVPSGIDKNTKPTTKVKSLPKSEYAVPYEIIHLKRNGPQELHYMSSPVPGWDKKKLPPTPRSQRKMKSAIKDLVNQSFSALKKTFIKSDDPQEDGSGDSDSDVSVKDVQERIIYVQSFRRKLEDVTIETTPQPKLFEYLLVIGLEWIDTAETYHPIVISQFPEQVEFKHDKTLISCFCYPDSESWKPVSKYESETYSFVLTDEKGSQTFAYCKRLLPQSENPCTPIVYCLVCLERDFTFYSKVLDELEKRSHHPEIVMNLFLSNLHKQNLPLPGESFCFVEKTEEGDEPVSIPRSADAQMESVEFSHLLKALDVENLLKAFSSILLERRILFCANTLGVLTHCVQAMAALLYPFSWQHTLVPVIPETMLDLCSMPTPYIMGILSSCVQKVTTLPLEDVLIVDLDHSRMIKELGDENTIIPHKVLAALSTALSLANNMTDPTASSLTLMMCEAFVQMFVRLVGHFENHIIENAAGVLQFERDSFCKAPYSRGIQSFLKWFCETQTFDVFIHNRVALKNSKNGRESEDGLFDRRAEEYRIEMEQMSQTFKGNVRGIGKKVKDFSDKLRNMKNF